MGENVTESAEPAAGKATREYHHGRTPAAWAGSIAAAVAFTLGAVGFLLGPNWTVVWIAVALLLVSIVLGAVLRRAGYGQE